jgi:hypothetical protein
VLDALRFVSSAVARKDYVPELTHFKIKQGRVTGFNGRIALSSPIDVDLDVQPKADVLLDAVRACPDTIALNITPAGRLALKSGRFRAYVPCLPNEAAVFVEPEGETVEMGSSFLEGIKRVAPAMGIDASRPWCMGIKLDGEMLYATNNIILAKYWHGSPIPLDVIIPSTAIAELLRIDEPPTRVQVTDTSISFWFGGERWLRSQLIEPTTWPGEPIRKVLDQIPQSQSPLSEGFAEALETLKPFLNEHGTIYLDPNSISTSLSDGEGALIEIELPGVTRTQAYHHINLVLLTELAETIDWSTYPAPCIFEAERILGAIRGQKLKLPGEN